MSLLSKDVTCVQHGDMLQNLYEDVLAICIDSADECIPKVNIGKNKEQRIPGWNDFVVDYHQEAVLALLVEGRGQATPGAYLRDEKGYQCQVSQSSEDG